jgi:hypothetical protein
MARHLSLDELREGLSEIMRSPKERGTLKAIVIRPETDARVSLQQGELSPEGGVYGDNWAKGCWLSLPDGRPHPDVQVTIMNARTIALIAQDEARWPLAGETTCWSISITAVRTCRPARGSRSARRCSRSPQCRTTAAASSRRATASTPPVSSTRRTASACTFAAFTRGSSSRARSGSAMPSRSCRGAGALP